MGIKRRHPGPGDRAEFERLCADGLTAAEICRETGFSDKPVVRHLKAVGVFDPSKTPVSPEKSAAIADWYLRGVEVSTIMRRFNVAEVTVYRHVRKHGVPRRRFIRAARYMRGINGI